MPTLRERHLRDGVAKTLPLLQRYARALNGGSQAGRAMVEKMRLDFKFDEAGPRLKTQLFASLQKTWMQSEHSTARGLTQELFLLHRMEGFSLTELSYIFNFAEQLTFRLLSKSEVADKNAARMRVLILEHDAAVTIDLCNCLEALGCIVVGIARTLPEAILKAKTTLPTVLIAECGLMDGSTASQTIVAISVVSRTLPTVFVDPEDPDAILNDDIIPGFPLAVPFLAADVEAVMLQATSLSRYEAAKALL